MKASDMNNNPPP